MPVSDKIGPFLLSKVQHSARKQHLKPEFLKHGKGAPISDRLANLVEHRANVREVAGSKLRPHQYSGSLNN